MTGEAPNGGACRTSTPQSAPRVYRIDVRTWLGLAAPKGTPAPVVGGLNAAVRAGLTNPQVDARLRKIGMDVVPSSPEEMRTLVASQVQNWKKVVADAKIPQN